MDTYSIQCAIMILIISYRIIIPNLPKVIDNKFQQFIQKNCKLNI